MHWLYTILLALTMVAFDPFGSSRGEIWTQPKVLAIVAICLANCCFLGEQWKAAKTSIDSNLKFAAFLWCIFLILGGVSTLHSFSSWRSFWGQDEMGDGWLYWLTIAVFTLSNTLLLRMYPSIARSQMRGVVLGGLLVSISTLPQAIDWRIDYTATMGKLLQEDILISQIFRNHQPIGLYSHRGHLTFALVVTIILLVLAWQNKWLDVYFTGNLSAIKINRLTIDDRAIVIVLLVFLSFVLILAQTRMGIVATIAGVIYFFGRRSPRILIPLTIVGVLSIVAMTTSKEIAELSLVKQFMSDRPYLWELAIQGIRQHPWLGWGFDGLGIAYPHLISPHTIIPQLQIESFSFTYLDLATDTVKRLPILSNKAHNLILDTTISVGILGTIAYLGLLGLYFQNICRSPHRGLEAIVIAYLIFTLMWFECAQFTHLVWWSLSLWGDPFDEDFEIDDIEEEFDGIPISQ